jgi:hypothetical protein
MNVLTPTAQQHVEDKLVEDGVITKEKLVDIKEAAKKTSEPFFGLLAAVSNVPYVNLSTARINPETLDLLSQDIAEHYMAVPLGKMQHRLVVAMLDADNVQAVDFLSNKIGKPLKVYAASEAGIRRVLGQYSRTLERGVTSILDKSPGLQSGLNIEEELKEDKSQGKRKKR